MSENIVVEEARVPNGTPVENSTPEPEVVAPETVGKVGNEAAKYRRQLRDTEAERDALKTAVNQARGQILAQTLDQRFYSVLKLSGRDLDTLFNDDGDLDEDALKTVGAELAAEFPGMIEPQRGEWHDLGDEIPLQLKRSTRTGAAAPFDPYEGRSPANDRPGNAWQGAFEPAHK